MIPEFDLLAKIEAFCLDEGHDYIDGIVEYCEINNIEVEMVAFLVKKDPLFKAKIQIEGEAKNVVKKTTEAKLPI